MKLKINVVDIDGNDKDFIMPAYVDWYNGKDLMKNVAREWGIPYESVTLTVIGSDFVVDPKLTFRELGIGDGAVIHLVRQKPVSESETGSSYGRRAGPLDLWERRCCICDRRMSRVVWAVIPACSGCYMWHKDYVDNFKRQRDQQN